MNLKISRTAAIELARHNKDNTLDLLGLEALAQLDENIAVGIKGGSLSPLNNFLNLFGLDSKFFYILERINNKTVVQYEHGIAHLDDIGGKIVLKRSLPISYGTNSNTQYPCYNGPSEFITSEGEYVIAYSTMPFSYLEALAQENCVLTSSADFTPQPVQLNKNSVLARLDDKIISLSLHDENFRNIIVEAFQSYTNQLKLKTSKLDVNKLSLKQLNISPSSQSSSKKGAFIYNEQKDCLQYYDGTKWKTLVTKDEDT